MIDHASNSPTVCRSEIKKKNQTSKQKEKEGVLAPPNLFHVRKEKQVNKQQY